ncbi:hypothetical protein Tco_0181993 [Tanacetum coccineum]
MAAPTIPVSDEENLGDPIDIRVDIIHLKPEEMSTLRFRMVMVDAENASLHGVTVTGPRELQEAPGVSHQSARTSPIDTLF